MSFGVSAGDFIVASQLAWKLYRRCKAAPEEFTALETEVSSFHVVLRVASEQTSIKDGLTPSPPDYERVKEGCYEVLHELEAILNKFESLKTPRKSRWDRARWSPNDVKAIRMRLLSHTNLLTAFNNAVASNSNSSAQERIESKLELILAEIKAGHREPDIFTTTSDSSNPRASQNFYKICKGLEDLGLDEGAVNDNKEAVISWMNRTIQSIGTTPESYLPSVAFSHSSNFELPDSTVSSYEEPIAQKEAALVVELVDLIGPASQYTDDDFPLSLQAAATHLLKRGDLITLLQGSPPLFICGPLVFPEILRATIEDVVVSATINRMIPATMLLPQRQSLKSVENPLPFPSQTRLNFIEGFLALNLSCTQRHYISNFYGSLYELTAVRVAARLQTSDTLVTSAEAYLWNGGFEESNIVGEWDVYKFMQTRVYQFYMSSAG